MAKQGNIKFGIQFQVDKAGLKTIETELKRISNMSVKDVINSTSITDATSKLNAAKTAATQMQQALEAGFNVKLNTVNLEKFQQSLKDSGTSLTKLQADLSHVDGGNTAFRNMTAQLLTTNKHLRESSELLTKMGNTLANTIRWSIASTAINSVTGSIQKAWSFTKQLDTSLNDIMIVTGKSADEMERFAVKANKAAKELGASTKAYSDASLIYYQQGLSDQEVAARSNVTVKAANVTGQSAQQVSEQLTAVWNGYKVSAQESEIYIDKLAAVAAKTAADLEELSTGMSRVASAANIMGVDIDQLNAQLATIVSVTREAPESIGTALKTVYARMSDLEAGLDAETTLGEYTKQMANFGIQALDANGKLRDMGDVVEEIGSRWSTLSRNQQVALAQTIAGTRQYSRMMSLFDNWDMYQDALKTSKGSAGTLQKQQDIYMESTEAHLEKLGATAEDLYASLFNTEDMNDLIDMLAKLVDGVDNFVEAIGGGAGVLRNFGAIAFNVFNKQIANSAARAVTNVQGFFDNQAQEKAQQQLLRDLGMGNMSRDDEGVREILELKKQIDSVNDLLTEDERKQGDEYIRQIASLRKQQDELKAKKKIIEETVRIATGEELSGDDWSNSVKVNTADRELKYSSQGFQALEAIMTDIIKESKSVGQAASRYGVASKSFTAYKGHQTRIKNQLEQAKIEGLPERSDELFDHPDYEFQGQDSTLLLQKQQEAEDKYAAALARRTTAYDELKIRLETMSGKTSELLSVEEQHALASMKLTTEEQEQANAYSKTIEEYHKGDVVFQQSEENIKEYQNAWKGLLEIISSSRQKMDDARKSIKTLNQEINQNEEDLKNTSQSVQYFTRSWDTKKIIANITSVTGSITALISTWQTLANLDDIWNSEDLTTGEKFAQIMMNVTMAAGTLIPTLISVIGFIKKKTLATSADAAANLVDAGTEKIKEAGIKATTKAILGQTAALLANPTTWIILGIVAAVAALTVGIYALVKAYNKDAEAAKKSAETAKELADSYQRVKEANEELKKSLADYNEQQKALDEMVKGTKEWEEALREANLQVLELLEKYPDLIKYIDKATDGRLTLTEEGQEFALEKSNAAVKNASYLKTMSAVVANNKQLTSDITDMARKETILYTAGYNNDQATSGGATATQVEPIIKRLAEENIQLTGKTVTEISTTLKELGLSTQAADTYLVASLKTSADAIDKLTIEMQKNTEVNELLTTQGTKDYLSTNDINFSSYEYQDQIANVIGEQAQAAYDAAKAKRDAQRDNKIVQEYADYMKESGQWADYTSAKDKGSEGVYTYTDAAGELHKDVKINHEVARSALASIDAMKAEGIDVSKTASTIAKIAGLGTSDMMSLGLANLAGKENQLANFGDMTQDEVNQIKELDLDSLNLTEEELKSLGYSSLEELKETVTKSADDYATALSTVSDSLSATAKESFDKIFAEDSALKSHMNNLSLKQKKAFANLYKDIFNEGGKEALDSFDKILADAGEKSDELVNMLTTETFDWSDKNVGETVKAKLDELGVELDNINFDNLIDQMKELNGVATGFNLQETQESIAQLGGVINSLSKQGDTISAEDYEALGDEAQNYFTQMADGTYMLTESVTGFSKAMKEYSQAKLLEEITEEFNDVKTQWADMAKLDAITKVDTTQIGVKTQQELQGAYTTAIRSSLDTEYTLNAENEDSVKNLVRRWLNNPTIRASLVETAINQGEEDKLLTNGQLDTEKFISQLNQFSGTAVNLKGVQTGLYGNLSYNMIKNDIANYEAAVQAGATISQQSNTNQSVLDNANKSLGILDSLSIDTLSSLGIEKSELDKVKTSVSSMNATSLTESDKNILQQVSDWITDMSANPVATKELVGGIDTYLKRASSEEQLEEYKTNIKTAFNYDVLTGNLKSVIDAALSDANVLDVVKQNETNEQLAIFETQLEAIEAINSEYEQMNSLLEHQRSLIELTAGENAYSEIGEVLTAQIDTIEDQLTNSRNAAAYWQNQMAQALADNQTELYEAAKANWEDASNTYYENMSQKIELLKEKYLNSIDAMFAAQEKLWTGGVLQDDGSIKGGYSIDYLEAEWDITQKRNDAYLDPVNAEFEKLKIENKYSTALNNAQSLNAQKRIKDLMEDELSVLEDKDKLSEYDLKRAEARLEVTKAQIALEEAQANKSKMRLTRSADGTYSYQYVADVDAVAKAQETLAQAQQDLYNLDVDEYEANLEEALSFYQVYKEKMREISQIGDKEEREAQMQLLQEEFGGLLTDIFGDNESIKENLTASFGMAASGLGEDFGGLTDAVAATNTQLATFVESMNFETLQSELDGLANPWDEINTATAEWESHLKNAETIVKDIANKMATATWRENANLKLTPFTDKDGNVTEVWDSEAIGKDIGKEVAKSLKGITLKELKDENDKTIGWEWVSAATGMYTGEWGPEGRLAVLHEKELVLNKTDTANILQAVDMIRTLENALSASMLENILSKMGGNGNPLAALDLAKDFNLEQNVHITAEFPNATDKSEIEAAFDELLNLATQQVFENKRE